jgi:hypothetical protein
MKRLGLIAMLVASVFSSQAIAEKVTYACQYTHSAGLINKNNTWTSTSFFLAKPFFLSSEGDSLTTESVANVLKSDKSDIFCADWLNKNSKSRSCMNGWGSSLYFNTVTLNGGVADLLAAGYWSDLSPKDSQGHTVFVSTFTCTKM